MDDTITLFLGGDVMTGRGIDQILPHPCDPDLHEPYVKLATAYRELAEEVNGPIPHPVPVDYIWGDALEELDRSAPDLRIVNLETAITRSDDWWPDKAIHYRMSPENARCLRAACIDACALANNHVLDWGQAGLAQTLRTLGALGIAAAGAGSDLAEAQAPAVLSVPGKGRVLLFSFGCVSSGIPRAWGAAPGRPGVHLLADLSPAAVEAVASLVRAFRKEGDLAVASVHWGGNWGYPIPPAQRAFARALIDDGGIDLVHGHSSHHAKGIEVHRGKLILYGCGDLLTDYEGISGFEAFRGDLGVMYFARLMRPEGKLVSLRMIPAAMRRFRLVRASNREKEWLLGVLNREGKTLGSRVEARCDGTLELAANGWRPWHAT